MKPADIKSELTAERLREVLRYEPDSGNFFWIKLPHQSASNICVDDVAGSADNTGYIRIRICGRRYVAHRLAWLYVHGSWPSQQVDHINGDRRDNRIENLRSATATQNSQNAKVHNTNFLGVKGVRLHECGRYLARITVNKKTQYLGLFDTAEQASAAYQREAGKHFGIFARQ